MKKKLARAKGKGAGVAADGAAADKTRAKERVGVAADGAAADKTRAKERVAREIFDALNTYRSLYWKSVDSIAAFRTAVAEDEPDEKQLASERVMVRAMRAVVKGGVCVRRLAEKDAEAFAFAAQAFCEALAEDENARLCDASLENEIQALAFAARGMAADAAIGKTNQKKQEENK